MNHTTRSEALGLLRTAVNDRNIDFRQGQWEAIDALANRRKRLLVVQRTGWGKSSVYFIATRILRGEGRGPTLIVSPLLALMRNQIQAAERLEIRARTVNSTNQEEWADIQRAIHEDEVDALLISPERLANDEFVENTLAPVAQNIGMLVVDEAHCISDWGHDFRPDYRRLVGILRRMPGSIPVLGTTATANNRVTEDIQTQLGNLGVQRGTLARESLALQTLPVSSQAERLAWLAEYIGSLPGAGIIYTLTKRDAEQVAKWLREKDVNVQPYHSGASGGESGDSNASRRRLEEQLLNNEVKALVATTALGMGYDKPDLGFVVHYQAPGSIVAYYQQVGRAGRGVPRAVGVMMAGGEDAEIHQYFRETAFPEEEWVTAILDTLEKSDGMSIARLEGEVNLRRGQIEQALKFLSVENPSPVIRSGTTWKRAPVEYRMDRDQIRRLAERRETEWRKVQEYVREKGCLMKFLAETLDDDNPRPCGKCASCLGQPIVETFPKQETIAAAARFLRVSEFALEPRARIPKNAFPAYGFHGRSSADLRAETGRVLSRWGDAFWGEMVAADKHDGRFRDELVAGVAEMINERWRPEPPPQWVTCVPSIARPKLVPDYAGRLAKALELPFNPAVKKVKGSEPQKTRQNGFHQRRNLDGVFALVPPVPKGPVLLVDDIVDSRWTMTVTAALLRGAGVERVWPLALATSSMSM
ncbi:MAG: RecQ family ATP-dependent DNA helicase [Alphaproteobacteria bacterium]|nr:RecQ family ATP-dependent DNA helicase [Alphaproteobacteria bacterium]MDA7983584.1 RecQ family ATP-dependent DNA helicase [Alphaproteobacteria bacterium]MDA7989152.1 RecQ family ATP-dependent DNA helicase [Alphaproteobacteria bacterium]MDA8009799.1 RecQ family ATP-dependent DNA helicase [Alphaproteobacteria bacterium]